jgi:hypothetical protein
MPEHRLPGRFTILGLGLVIALVLALPLGVAAAPTPVAVGASIQFVGNGFSPNESLSFWETGPDNTPIPLGGAQTDGSGGFTFTVSFPSAGTWQVTAHSILSGHEVTSAYAVGDTTGITGSPVVAPVSSTTSSALPAGTLPAGIGVPVSFSSNGFTANESISLWETAPDSTVTGLTGTQADGNGAFNVSVTFPTAGNWQITAHGVTSGVEIIGRYAVGTTATSGSSFVPTAGSQGFSTVPPVALGSAVTFSGNGFNSGEDIKMWETAPDTSVAALSDVAADGTGTFTATITFPSIGNWQVTAHGKDSLHEVIGRYTITSDGSAVGSTVASSGVIAPTTSTTGATIGTTTGTTVNFLPTGYNAGEIVSVWSTGPDGSVTTLDSTQASSSGRAVISVSFASAGLWQITAQGRTSGHIVVGRYQVSDQTSA